MSADLRGPPLSSRNGEKSEKRPQHIVVVELIFLPLPRLGRHVILIIIQKHPSNKHKDNNNRDRI